MLRKIIRIAVFLFIALFLISAVLLSILWTTRLRLEGDVVLSNRLLGWEVYRDRNGWYQYVQNDGLRIELTDDEAVEVFDSEEDPGIYVVNVPLNIIVELYTLVPVEYLSDEDIIEFEEKKSAAEDIPPDDAPEIRHLTRSGLTVISAVYDEVMDAGEITDVRVDYVKFAGNWYIIKARGHDTLLNDQSEALLINRLSEVPNEQSKIN